ncbi:MAG: transposase, partial [Methanospirillum sp.]|uniref:IS66 family transposase n=1 Tax=Methanospirillum sp. TaxID=45200 RepID=UPI00236CEE95
DKLFVFVTNPEVDGTNNRAERAVRPNVVLRKVSGGTKSPKRTRNIEVLASAIQTCQMNGANFVEKGRVLIKASDS